MNSGGVFVIGAGVSGLAVGLASDVPIYEAADHSGGICASYYVRPGTNARSYDLIQNQNAYHFEIGGGHWIFGGDPAVLNFIRTLTPIQSYRRRSSVYFPDRQLYVPYPLQNHLGFLHRKIASQALIEMAKPQGEYRTMKEWLASCFGPTLCELFFYPFHDLYTAGFYDRIAPQDAYKSPVDLALAIKGAFDQTPPVGYNATFVYPDEGLNTLAQRMADRCNVNYGHRAMQIDVHRKAVLFANNASLTYDRLISTLPLDQALAIAGLTIDAEPDPYTSVMVLNIGAVRGESCPDDHWLYVPQSAAGFHRVGFYSNVDPAFLPISARETGDRVSIYVERAYPGGQRPSDDELAEYSTAVVRELQTWGYIKQVEVLDPTWIDVAYTWSWPGSRWKQQAMRVLEEHGIHQVGRYGRWVFQGIADSIRDGFVVGSAMKV